MIKIAGLRKIEKARFIKMKGQNLGNTNASLQPLEKRDSTILEK
jgi:hypothetical protein